MILKLLDNLHIGSKMKLQSYREYLVGVACLRELCMMSTEKCLKKAIGLVKLIYD